MDKTFYEFDDGVELYNRLKFWSNAAGELHHYGQYDLNDASELPKELQRAYDELWNVGDRCLEYLVEFDGKYYVALISEFCRFFAEDEKISMEELYKLAKQNALELYHQDLFKDTILIIGKETGLNECHEIIFLVPAIELRRVYREIEDAINQNIWEINKCGNRNYKTYDFECNLSEGYKDLACCDEWGSATLWLNDKQGVEYNFCIDGNCNLCAIYKMYYDEETDTEGTDSSTFEHYEIDFDNANWRKELEKAMHEAAKKFFK